jgi:hypothetical protein
MLAGKVFGKTGTALENPLSIDNFWVANCMKNLYPEIAVKLYKYRKSIGEQIANHKIDEGGK